MTDHGESYVRKVSEETSRYTRELLKENQKLRALAMRLDADRKRLEAERDQHAAMHREERAELEKQLDQLESESRRYLENYLDLEQQNTNLANLYVASYRLHSTLARNEVLAGIQEIIVNLIGSEELVVCETSGARPPAIAVAMGVDAATFDDLPSAAQQKILTCMRTRQPWLRDGSAMGDGNLSACIPLVVNGEAIGAIAVFRLLQQKSGLEPVDRELFELLATHAATALYSASLHETAAVM